MKLVKYYDYFDCETNKPFSGDFYYGVLNFLRTLGFNDAKANRASGVLLCSMWNENLKYHTPYHILSILGFCQKNDIKLTPAQELAIWFHDAIYEVGEKDCEERSAYFMLSLLGENEITEKAAEYITETANYSQDIPLEEDAALILDLDLCGFASDNFEVYDKAIADEFIPVFGKEKFTIGRKQFFETMLSKSCVYRTDIMKQFEEKARINLTNRKNLL